MKNGNLFGFEEGCFICGSEINMDKHHLDGDHKNTRNNNRVRLCKNCHVSIHQYYGCMDYEELEKIKKIYENERAGKRTSPPLVFEK